MVTVNLGNKAGNTANVNYTLSNGCSDSIISDMVSSVGWMAAIASNGTIRVSATEDNTGDERSGYITPVVNGESCTNNRFMVTQEAGEEPEPTPTDCKCLVDNCEEPGDFHEAELEASAGITCDSAWANNPYNYGFDVTYSQSSGGPWTSKSGNDNWLRPVIVAKAGCNSGPTGQANYEYLENTTGSERWAKVHWFWNRDQEEGMCSESNAYFRQFGGEVPGEPCNVSLTVSGLEGTDKATIHWGYGNEEQFGNGTTSHTYSSGGKHTASVSAPGYTTDYAYFDCENGTTALTATIQKSAGGCSCDDFVLNEDERIQTIDYRVQTITVSYTLPNDCVLRVYHQPTWVSECTINPSTKKISITVDEVSEPKQGTVEFEVDDRHCTAQNKAIGIERKENECKFPGDTIQIMLTGLNSSYEYYVLTDQVIGVNCTEWIKSNGHKYYPTNSGIRSLGYYQYQACTLTQYDSGENSYCSITTPGSATCNGSNTSLSSNTTYHLYGFTGTNFSEIRSVTMPDGDTAQSGANSEKQYVV